MGILRSLHVAILALFFAVSANATLVINPPQKRTYNDVQAFLGELAQTYKSTTQLIEIGQDNLGNTIVGVKIGNGSIHNLVVGTHHGNEYGATEVALGAALEFAKNPIATQTIYVIPVLNITGYNAKNREESLGSGMMSTQDPNRDYPGPCGTQGPHHLNSTKALADLVDREQIVSSVTLHTYASMVLYPWGVSTSDTKTAYNDQFIALSDAAAQFSHYAVGNSTDALYPADGAYEDYAFWKHGIWSLLFEMGSTHSPSQPAVDEMVAGNVPGIRAFFETAPTQRAADHEFRGRCETHLRSLDLRNE